jgi:exopolyphosphatase/guanosine-5'-triphosphate,3'-diphosphate pyrophosphatase
MNRWTALLIAALVAIVFIAKWLPLPFHKSSTVVPATTTVIPSTTEVRAAMDIGSGATNLKVARVDRKTDKIVSYLFEKSIPVPYQKHLEQSSNNTFDQEVMNQGIQSIKELKKMTDQYKVKKVVAVATAAFRKAANAREFAEKIQSETGVQVMIINQDEEGVLAFRGALAVTPVKPEEAVVWDIGGGSMQLTVLTKVGSYFIEKGKTASIPFKNAIIREIKKEDIQTVQSPNPLSPEQIAQSFLLAGKYADGTDAYIKDKIKDKHSHLIGVGSLFKYGIRPLVGNKTIVKESELKESVNKLADKSDAELPGGSLAEVSVSNPLLVAGYMKALGIDEVEVVDINNADGALTYPPYWE